MMKLTESVVERHVGRGYSWEHQESGTLYRFLETFYRVPKGKSIIMQIDTDIRLV
jgi:hypothetical protein